MNKEQWLKQFLDPFKEPVTPKPRKPTRTPEQMMQDAIEKFTALNLPDVTIIPSEVGWYIWISGLTKPHKDLLASMGCVWYPEFTAWCYTASKRKRNPVRT